MRRKESLYAVIGGVVGAVLAMAAGHVVPIGAQNGDATFGAITCTELRVLDVAGRTGTLVGHDDNGGYVVVYNKDFGTTTGVGVAQMSINESGDGELSALSAVGVAKMRADGDGGAVEILGRSGAIMMKFSEYGGRIVAGGRKNSGLAQLGVGKRGGWVSVSGAGDSEGKARMSIDEDGGSVEVYGNDGKQRVAIGVNEDGNGAVSTWDKNGYRQ